MTLDKRENRTTSDGALARLLFFLTAAWAMLVRAPWDIVSPAMLYREGMTYFAHAYNHSWISALLSPHQGHYSLVPNVSTLLATRLVPLESAPFVTLFISCVFQLIPLAIALWGRFAFRVKTIHRLVMATAILLAPGSAWAWLSTINSQYYLAVACFLLLFLEEPRTAIGRTATGMLLLISVLTSPQACFLAPAFLLQAIQKRTRWSYMSVLLIALGGMIQVAAVLWTFRTGTAFESRYTFQLALLPAIIWVKNIAFPFLGRSGADFFATRLVWAHADQPVRFAWYLGSLAVVECAAIALLYFRLEPRMRGPAMLALLAVALFSPLFAIEDRMIYVRTTWGARYFYASNAMLYVLVVFAAIRPAVTGLQKWISGGFCMMLAIGLFVNGMDYGRQMPRDPGHPDWKAEIAKWRADPLYLVDVGGGGWKMELKAPDTDGSLYEQD